MSRRISVLVVASATATSPQLLAAMKSRAEEGPIHVTLLMPCSGVGLAARDSTASELEQALAQWRAEGFDAEGLVGDQDPMVAVDETWDPQRFDEIIVSTLPAQASKWLLWDLPHRIARHTDAKVTHVVSRAPQAPLRLEPTPPREKSPLGPLSILAWGHPKDETAEERERRLRALRR